MLNISSDKNPKLILVCFPKHLRHFDQIWKCGNIKGMSCLANRGQKVKAEIASKCTRKKWKLFKVSVLKESESYLLLFIVSSFNRYLSISVRQKPCFRMENKKLLEKLSQMRKNFVADRVRDKQDLVYVEVMHCHFGLAIKYFHPHLSLWRLQSFYRAFRNMFSVHSSIRLIETHITGWDALQWYALNLPKGFIKRKKRKYFKSLICSNFSLHALQRKKLI